MFIFKADVTPLLLFFSCCYWADTQSNHSIFLFNFSCVLKDFQCIYICCLYLHVIAIIQRSVSEVLSTSLLSPPDQQWCGFQYNSFLSVFSPFQKLIPNEVCSRGGLLLNLLLPYGVWISLIGVVRLGLVMMYLSVYYFRTLISLADVQNSRTEIIAV